MNSAYTSQNDINSFRSGIESEHQTFAAGLAAKQGSYLNNLANVKQNFAGKLDEARGTLESAQELLKTGFESEAGIAGGAIAAKAAVHLKRVVNGTHDYRGNLTEKGRAAGQKNPDVENESNTANPGEDNPASNLGENRVARPSGGDNTGEGADSGGGREMDFRANKPTNQYTRDGFDENTGLKSGPQADPASTSSQGESKQQFDDLTADDGESKSFDFDGPTDPLAKIPSEPANPTSGGGGGGSSSNLGDGLESGLTDGLEEAAETGAKVGGESVLDAAAAAFSWVPFVGEVLTGAAAVIGIGTAIAGGVETIEAGIAEGKEQAAAAMGIGQAEAARPTTAALNYAGGYVAPSVSSIQT